MLSISNTFDTAGIGPPGVCGLSAQRRSTLATSVPKRSARRTGSRVSALASALSRSLAACA